MAKEIKVNNVRELAELLTKATTKNECYEILKVNKFDMQPSNAYPEGKFKGTHWHYNHYKEGNDFDTWQDGLYVHEKEFIDCNFTSITDFDSQVYNFPKRKVGHIIEIREDGKDLIIVNIYNKS